MVSVIIRSQDAADEIIDRGLGMRELQRLHNDHIPWSADRDSTFPL